MISPALAPAPRRTVRLLLDAAQPAEQHAELVSHRASHLGFGNQGEPFHLSKPFRRCHFAPCVSGRQMCRKDASCHSSGDPVPVPAAVDAFFALAQRRSGETHPCP